MEAYLIIGALFLLAVKAQDQTWPSPVEVVVMLLLWPLVVMVGLWRGINGQTKSDSEGGDKDRS